MAHDRVSAFCVLLVKACLLIATGSAAAQSWPTKPVRLVVPIAPGGSNDFAARVLAQKLTGAWSQPVIVDNRPGGGGIAGTEIAAKAPGDGYTLLIVNISHAVNPALHRKLPYDLLRDFTAITLIGSAPNLLVAHPSVPVNTVKELIALARTSPGKLLYASAGNASSPHLAAELFKLKSATDMVHVPYKGSGPGLIALMGSEVALSFPVLSSALPFVKAGRLKAIAVTTRARAAALPAIPTVIESGIPDYEFSAWFGSVVAMSTPAALVSRLNRDIGSALGDAEVRAQFGAQGLDAVSTRPEQFQAFLRDEIAKWRQVVAVTGIKAD